jgi:hydrogenase maturation protein HypF
MKMEHLEYKTKNIRVYGIVQGVGFRPFVSRIADSAGVTGSVANKGSYVQIYVTGTKEQIHVFFTDLKKHPPERASILKIDCKDMELTSYDRFEIIESEKEAGDIFVSPDIAVCPKCKKELYDPNNRRYMHPFINCTACGPRLTILDSMPYDRIRTSMGEFPMCPECEYEYTHAETRRYDAQPVCCNDCGPEVYLIGKPQRGREAITLVRTAITQGQIVAIKGIGGFHLCCDATNGEAVRRLRTLKRRPVKPFAVMMKDMDTVMRECLITKEKKEVLDGWQKPILLLEKKENGRLADVIAPGNPKVGVMLPYAPVQMLLFDYNDGVEMTTDCFVMTSGNVSGAPICRTEEDAVRELSSFCDLILSHNRKIRLRADDSVMDFYEGRPYMIRRSRGYAPLPFMMSHSWNGQVLAVGGELKNTFCLGKNQLFYPSPYVGDMADIKTVTALSESIVRMEELLETKPSIVACDMHPKYNTTMIAEEQGLPVLQVQHHYAHIASCMAENDYEKPVIGVAFDGTGYGTDQTIWGGEILIADFYGFSRKASIRPFLQIGGDASAKEGWRIAVSMINALYPDRADKVVSQLGLCDEPMRALYQTMAEKKINSVVSTSAGRLFDAVSAILGIRLSSTHEGEASMMLEFAAERYEDEAVRGNPEFDAFIRSYEENLIMPQPSEYGWHLPTDRLVKFIIEQRCLGEEAEKLAYFFHFILAKQILAVCKELSAKTGLFTCALSGGVFQNQLLLELCDKVLSDNGFHVLKHSLVPPNDGGIALGQAVIAMAQINQDKQEELLCV